MFTWAEECLATVPLEQAASKRLQILLGGPLLAAFPLAIQHQLLASFRAPASDPSASRWTRAVLHRAWREPRSQKGTVMLSALAAPCGPSSPAPCSDQEIGHAVPTRTGALTWMSFVTFHLPPPWHGGHAGCAKCSGISRDGCCSAAAAYRLTLAGTSLAALMSGDYLPLTSIGPGFPPPCIYSPADNGPLSMRGFAESIISRTKNSRSSMYLCSKIC